MSDCRRLVRVAITREQMEIVRCSARFMFLATGRRWGKTKTGAIDAVSYTLSTPGVRYGVLAPTYPQLFDIFSEIIGLPVVVAAAAKIHQDKPYPFVLLHNGSRIDFRSLQKAKNIRGGQYHRIFMDETQDVNEETYTAIVEPMISDLRGCVIFAGQFRGRDWRYWRYFVPGVAARLGAAGMSMDEIGEACFCSGAEVEEAVARVNESGMPLAAYSAWRYPTSTGIRFKSAAGRLELGAIKGRIPRAIWDQEYDCIPGTKENAVFRPEDLEAAKHGEVLPSGRPGDVYIKAADLGRIVDRTATVVLRSRGPVDQPPMFCHENLRPHRERYQASAQAFARIDRAFAGPAVLDATGGAAGGSKERVREQAPRVFRAAVPDVRYFTWGGINKQEAVQDFALALEQAEVWIPAELRELRRQLGNYEYHYDYHSKKYRYQGPGGADDDLVSASLLAWQGHLRRWATATGDPFVAGV